MSNLPESVMCEYIAGFNDGYAYVLQEIERHPDITIPELLRHLKGNEAKIEQKSQAISRAIANH